MAGFLKKIFTSGVGEFAEKVGSVVDRFVHTKDEKAEFMLEMERLLQQRDSEIEATIQKELETAATVITAELQQGDNYTKRARPTIIYTGLAMYVLNSIIFPKLAILTAFISNEVNRQIVIDALQPVAIPPEFAVAWGGIVAIYSGGRTLEKRGARGAAVQAMTGNGDGVMALFKKK